MAQESFITSLVKMEEDPTSSVRHKGQTPYGVQSKDLTYSC